MKTFLCCASAVLLVGFCSCASSVTPPLPPNVRIDPDPVPFGDVFVGDTKNMPAVVTNNTAAHLRIATSSVQPGTPFSPGTTPTLPAIVSSNGDFLPFRFDFKPVDVGDFTAKWTVNINATDYSLDPRGKGVGVDRGTQGIGFTTQELWITETNGIDFGPVPVGQPKKGRLELLRTAQNLTIKIPPTISEQPGNPRPGAFRLLKPRTPPATLTLVDRHRSGV